MHTLPPEEFSFPQIILSEAGQTDKVTRTSVMLTLTV